jgi:hypothetical protein
MWIHFTEYFRCYDSGASKQALFYVFDVYELCDRAH